MEKTINTLLAKIEDKYKYKGITYFDTNTAISYELSLYTEKLFQILKSNGMNDEEAESIIANCITESIETMANNLATETFCEKLDRINSFLYEQPLSITDITKFTKSPVNTYDTMNEIIAMLTYEDTHPLEIFSDFIHEYDIDLRPDREKKCFKFKINDYRFTENPEKWYKCKDFATCLSICRSIMIDKLYEEYRDFKFDSSFHILPSNFKDKLDKDLHTLGFKDLYLYLASNKFVKMNLPLSYMYLLLYCNEFTDLSDKAIMKKIYSSMVKAEKVCKSGSYYPTFLFNFKDFIEKE